MNYFLWVQSKTMWLGMKQDMKELDNIIQSGPECTPGLEVSGSKKTDVASPNIGQAKPGLDRSKTWRTAES